MAEEKSMYERMMEKMQKEQEKNVILRAALALEAKLLVLHDSYDTYHKNYSPEALKLYAGFGNFSDAVHRIIKSGQLDRLPSDILHQLAEYSLMVSDELNLGVRMESDEKDPIENTGPTLSFGKSNKNINEFANLGNNIYSLPKINLYHKEFKQKVFTRGNPLNQLDLDKALGLDTDSRTTVSCQTTAMINAYASTCEGGITGEQILFALINTDGTFKSLYADGSPKSLDSLSRNIAKAMNRDTYKAPQGSKKKPTILANLKDGAILGWAKNGKTSDSHFGYTDWISTVDSLDSDRPSAKNYSVNSYRILIEKKL